LKKIKNFKALEKRIKKKGASFGDFLKNLLIKKQK